ncbi:MAG: histidinol-phosphatase [Gemmatimonadetes bacterium]|nr:histidinol-phosphatase [Gemmatimonadota bacterium]
MTDLRHPASVPGLVRCLLAAVTFGVVACGPSPEWYKGNLHTHSYWSDGDQFPEVILLGYRDRGYDFVALSDHNVLAQTERWVTVGAIPNGEASLAEYRGLFGEEWVETRQNEAGRLEVRLKRFDEYAGRVGEPGRFLVLQGEEITDRFESRPLHLNATNVAGFIPPQGGTSVADVLQRNIAAVLEQRRATEQPMFPHVNHPNFGWAVTAEDLMDLDGERFFEVYNGHPLVHNAGDSLHPWVMVRATALAPEAIVAAMEAGEFYASTGVVLADIEWSESGVALRIAGEPGVTYLTEFVGTRAGFDREVREVPDVGGLPVTRRYSADIGTVLAEVPGLNPAYAFTGDEIYVRARVRSSQPVDHPVHAGEVQMAWVQPVVVGSGGR